MTSSDEQHSQDDEAMKMQNFITNSDLPCWNIVLNDKGLNEPDEEPLTSTFVEDETAGGSFHKSPPRSHEETPSAGQPSGVAEDPLTLTALSSLVSKFMQKTTSLETELKDTKKTLGTAIITLVGRVKKLEGALKKRKREPIILYDLFQVVLGHPLVTHGGLTYSSANQDIHADIFVTPGNMPISTGSGTIPAGVSVPTGSSPFPADCEQIPPLKDERLRWEAAERLHAQEQAELERQQEELLWQDELLACQLYQDFDIPAQQKKRHQEVQAAVMHYTDDGWITIMGKIQANEELSRTLIGSILHEGDFASAMVEMVDRKSFSTLTQQDFTRASKRLGDELEQPSSKRPKPAEVETTSAAIEDTGAQLPISSEDVQTSKESEVMEEKYASDEEDDSDSDTLVPFYAVVDWELLPTGLGTINVIYRKDNSLMYFPSLRELLHLVTREDLMTIYGRVVTYYQEKEADGVGLILWGDLRVLIDSPEEDDGSSKWPCHLYVCGQEVSPHRQAYGKNAGLSVGNWYCLTYGKNAGL
ncbi:hypothetical protein Tco_1297598 [Tanacetum coccineum]